MASAAIINSTRKACFFSKRSPILLVPFANPSLIAVTGPRPDSKASTAASLAVSGLLNRFAKLLKYDHMMFSINLLPKAIFSLIDHKRIYLKDLNIAFSESSEAIVGKYSRPKYPSYPSSSMRFTMFG